MASVGKAQFSGFFAWVLWLAVHLVYIIGFKHRITTLLHWAVTFLGRGRSERVVTEQQVFARQAIADLGRTSARSCPRLAKDRAAGAAESPATPATDASSDRLTAADAREAPRSAREPAGGIRLLA